jgi:hypothetical protein
VPITFADSKDEGTCEILAGDGKGPLCVSLDRPDRVTPPSTAYPEGRLLIDRLGTKNVAPLVIVDSAGIRQINPALAANNIMVIKDTHGKTSHLSAADIEAISAYLRSLQR